VTFLLDENFPRASRARLEAAGHVVHDVRLLCPQGTEDSRIVEMAQELGAVILTTDRDFFHTLPHLFPNHCGVVVVALRKPSRDRILDRLAWLLSNLQERHWPGRAFQLRDTTWISFPGIEIDPPSAAPR
jgi:predicted nuclease of predicted toxin-antitoxin system